jgi:hypothetical protein|tara:strand:+ start:357 stop:500 length:144 start_codon:yes stop_codon:yes gene_type:complete
LRNIKNVRSPTLNIKWGFVIISGFNILVALAIIAAESYPELTNFFKG